MSNERGIVSAIHFTIKPQTDTTTGGIPVAKVYIADITLNRPVAGYKSGNCKHIYFIQRDKLISQLTKTSNDCCIDSSDTPSWWHNKMFVN